MWPEQGGEGEAGRSPGLELGPDHGSSTQLRLWDPPFWLLGSQGLPVMNGTLGGVLNQGALLPPSHVPPWSRPHPSLVRWE